jgi:hypothetical protein
MRTNEVPLLADALDEEDVAKLALTHMVAKEKIHEFLMKKLQAINTFDTITKQYQDNFEEAKARFERKKQQNKTEWMKFEQRAEELKNFLNSNL